ncbi:hypothetical protein ACFQWB_08340 [Paenibacillus thermoaerophilus]|uniref:Uncharacterized protein n=1 Tax=Paenibacillus thermoaerophilus TaxID=1215385 RepID=A0ABW2V4X7_9BACL|nr:hypothetical protein [Paenibacillus thermoaerophilus]TMV18479.1 hypothetical protein FE781_03440 [Paenibacillus thermoaerophilus]
MNEQEWREALAQAIRNKGKKSRLESRIAHLRGQLRAEEKRVVELMVQLDREQEDVRKLTSLSWTNLFHTLLRSKEEQLEMERQQALAAALRLQESERTVGELKQEIAELLEQLSGVDDAERQYQALLAVRERQLRESGDPQAERLMRLDERISEAEMRLKDVKEAKLAGNRLRSALSAAEECLSQASGWGQWDMLGGGTVSTLVKHSHLDDAREHVHRARRLLDQFRKELEDLRMTAELELETGGFAKFADFFFDGLIADWIMQNRIEQSRSQVRRHLQAVGALLRRLDESQAEAERELARLKLERTDLLEGR